MGPPGSDPTTAPTTVAVNNQGLTDLLQAAVTGLQPMTYYQLALAQNPSSPYGKLEPIVAFTTNPAGAQIVDTLGPLRQVVTGRAQKKGKDQEPDRQYLVIIPASGNSQPLQVQLD
jgi:hypothetical protein